MEREETLGRRPFRGPAVGLGALLFVVLALLATSHAVFPFFPSFPAVLFFFAMRTRGGRAWHRRPSAGIPTADGPSDAEEGGIGKEKELLRALERHGEISAARAALETSLGLAEAEEMLSRLANDGHVRVSANGVTLQYGLWE